MSVPVTLTVAQPRVAVTITPVGGQPVQVQVPPFTRPGVQAQVLSRAAYDALDPKDPATLYFVEGRIYLGDQLVISTVPTRFDTTAIRFDTTAIRFDNSSITFDEAA